MVLFFACTSVFASAAPQQGQTSLADHQAAAAPAPFWTGYRAKQDVLADVTQWGRQLAEFQMCRMATADTAPKMEEAVGALTEYWAAVQQSAAIPQADKQKFATADEIRTAYWGGSRLIRGKEICKYLKGEHFYSYFMGTVSNAASAARVDKEIFVNQQFKALAPLSYVAVYLSIAPWRTMNRNAVETFWTKTGENFETMVQCGEADGGTRNTVNEMMTQGKALLSAFGSSSLVSSEERAALAMAGDIDSSFADGRAAASKQPMTRFSCELDFAKYRGSLRRKAEEFRSVRQELDEVERLNKRGN